jgi:hypothetical protein
MKRSIRKWWLEAELVITGAEGEGADPPPPGEGDDGGDDSGADDSNDGDAGDSDDGEDDSDDKETFTKEDVEGLRKALKEERKARRTAERANKAKAQQDSATKEKDEADDAAKRLKTAEDRTAKLAEGYRTARVEAVISKLARAANVVEPEDMVALLKSRGYADIDIDQDDDDPSKVEIDEDDVKAAIKTALKTRKHWIKVANEDDDESRDSRSGSPMRGSGRKSSQLDEEKLKEMYPALRARR